MVGKMYTRKMRKNYLSVILEVEFHAILVQKYYFHNSTHYISEVEDIMLEIKDIIDSETSFTLKHGRGKNQFGWLYFSVNENEYIAQMRQQYVAKSTCNTVYFQRFVQVK